MKRFIHVLGIVCLLSTYCYSQSLSPSILSAQGGHDRADQMTIEWTLGENFIETVAHRHKIYTQGFHQPLLIKEKQQHYKIASSDLEIKVIPNPVQDILNIIIKDNDSSTLNFSLYDMIGKEINTTRVYPDNSSLAFDVHRLPAGIYLLHISDTQGTIIETYKIVKN